MKPFWGINLTYDKKNEQPDGDEFLAQTPSPALTEAHERSSESAVEIIQKSELPLLLRIMQWGSGLLGAMMLLAILKAMIGEDAVSFRELLQNASVFLGVAVLCLMIWAILTVLSIRKGKSVLESDESEHVFGGLERVGDAILAELGVPSTAKEADILSFYYTEKADGIKVHEKALQLAPYETAVVYVFADSDNVYLANMDGKYAFSRSSIQRITTVKKAIRTDSWNKEEPLNKGEYKQYKLSEDDSGCVHCKAYHILEIEREGELWGIYIPCYELPVFEELTGLKAEKA